MDKLCNKGMSVTQLASQSPCIWINTLKQQLQVGHCYQVSGVLRRSDRKLLENGKATRSQR